MVSIDRNVRLAGGMFAVLLCGAAGAQPTLVEEALLQSPAMMDDDGFGHGLAVNDDYLVIGAPDEDPNGFTDGVMRIYDRDSGALLHTVYSPASASFSEFAAVIEINDMGEIAVLLNSWDHPGGLRRRVQLYDASTGAFVREFVKPEVSFNDKFGDAIAISDDYVVVGDYGRDGAEQNEGEVFVYDKHTGALLHRWTSDAPAQYTSFGQAVAIEGATVLVYANDEVEYAPGEIAENVVWVYDAVSGARTGAFYPTDDGMGESPRFTPSIDVDGGVVAIGASADDDGGFYVGAAYLFTLLNGSMLHKIPWTGGGEIISFGYQVALDDGVLVVSAPQADVWMNNDGLVRAFDMWSGAMIAEFWPSPASLPEYDQFGQLMGYRVAINGDRLWAATETRQERPGSMSDDGFGANAVYAFSIPQCMADLTGDGSLDYFDLSMLLQTQFDYNGDMEFDFFDVSAFMMDLLAGCP